MWCNIPGWELASTKRDDLGSSLSTYHPWGTTPPAHSCAADPTCSCSVHWLVFLWHCLGQRLSVSPEALLRPADFCFFISICDFLCLFFYHQSNSLQSEMGTRREPSLIQQSGDNRLQPSKGSASLASLPKSIKRRQVHTLTAGIMSLCQAEGEGDAGDGRSHLVTVHSDSCQSQC